MFHNLASLTRLFAIYGDFAHGEPLRAGHINDTYLVEFNQGGRPARYVLQRINQTVFQNAELLMDNVYRVTEHTWEKLRSEGFGDVSRRTLTLIPARDGKPFARDVDGSIWRVYLFIENAATYNTIESPAQAYQASRAFAQFQKQLVDLPGRLDETIPRFHDTRHRFNDLIKAVDRDSENRASLVKPEIEFVVSREQVVDRLLDLYRAGEIPERITHNDTKLNNVMIDDASGEGLCVIDLDTVMPGLALYDFGDMVRTATSPAEEDELDLSKVEMQMPMFEALVTGYLSVGADFLNAAEIDNLAFSGKLITMEIGMRFLTDYLKGDVYFKTDRESHNLDRCRTQFKLVECIEGEEEVMKGVVDSCYAKRVS